MYGRPGHGEYRNKGRDPRALPVAAVRITERASIPSFEAVPVVGC